MKAEAQGKMTSSKRESSPAQLQRYHCQRQHNNHHKPQRSLDSVDELGMSGSPTKSEVRSVTQPIKLYLNK